MAARPLEQHIVTRAEIEEFVARLVAAYHPERVILFGSHARGEATPHSDVDLLVVMDYEGRPWETAVPMKRALQPRFRVDLLIRTSEELDEVADSGEFVLREAIESGQVIYESGE